ncbi:MAG: SH3 domain-containing protein [Microcoleus sp. SIO2G3]|nr:SH3 domain-containing protein [Microcoleus sp. SIO2G3]
MKTINSWGKPVTILALGLSLVGYLNTPSTAVSNTTTANVIQKPELNSSGYQGNIQLAQSVVSQCRAAKQRIFIYPERSTSSQSIRTLAPDEQVTLADSGAAGWVAISFPVAGYVQAIDLKPCPGGTRPPNTRPPNTQPPSSGSSQAGANVCRKVIAPPEGLAVRGTPVSSAPRIAGVYVGNTVRLASPRETQKDTQGRTWVRITAPSTGWISSGYPDTNLSPEFSCP